MRNELFRISNAIYISVHNFYNTRARLTKAFEAAGLPDPPTQGDVNKLDTSQTRKLKIAVLAVVIDALKLGAIEDELDYETIQAAHDDAHNHIPDAAELVAIQGNLVGFMGLQDALSKMTDKGLALTQVLGARGMVDALDSQDAHGNASIDKFNMVVLPLE